MDRAGRLRVGLEFCFTFLSMMHSAMLMPSRACMLPIDMARESRVFSAYL